MCVHVCMYACVGCMRVRRGRGDMQGRVSNDDCIMLVLQGFMSIGMLINCAYFDVRQRAVKAVDSMHMHTQTHAYMHTHTQTRAHTHAHTRTHTRRNQVHNKAGAIRPAHNGGNKHAVAAGFSRVRLSAHWRLT
jgi:hypothetical protein